MAFADFVRAEEQLKSCPTCPACKAVVLEAIAHGITEFNVTPWNPARSTRNDGGIRVNSAMITFGKGDNKYSFSIHHLQNQQVARTRNGNLETCSTLRLTSLLITTGAFYFINVPNFNKPPPLLILLSSDLIGEFFPDESQETAVMRIPVPVCDTDKFPFGKSVGNWGIVPM